MAGPAAPSSLPSASASTSAVPKEMAFPLPPTTLQSVEKKLATKPQAVAPAGSPMSEQVLAPDRGSLAAGRYEARPVTIWLVIAVGALLVLGWALMRVRRARIDRQKKLDALTTLKKPGQARA